VPVLEDDAGAVLTQSLAIIEWLDETHPEPPLLPKDPLRRAKARAFADVLACDTHPVQNLKVLARLRELGLSEDKVTAWAGWANREGLAACEKLIASEPGPFCFGTTATIADLCLVPQLANARRSASTSMPSRGSCRRRPPPRRWRPLPMRHRTAARCRNKSINLSMDAVYGKPGYLFRRIQQIAVADLRRGVQDLRPDAGTICRVVAIQNHPGIDATRLSAVIASIARRRQCHRAAGN